MVKAQDGVLQGADTQQGNSKKKVPGKPFQKGKSGNPKGRPKKDVCLTSLLKEEIEKICPFNKENKTWLQLTVEATMRLAIQGNSTALKEVWERIDGKVKDNVVVDAGIRVIEFPESEEDDKEWEKKCQEDYARRAASNPDMASATRTSNVAT